jgi:hypothetical protein
MEDKGIRWVAAHEIQEAQTRALADTYKSSQPQPRNWAMGFTGSDDDEEAVPVELARIGIRPSTVRRARLLGAFRK